MLSAWGTAAATVNLTAMLVDCRLVAKGRPATALGVVASLRVHAATSLWAFTGVAVGQRRRSRPVAVAACVAAALASSRVLTGPRS